MSQTQVDNRQIQSKIAGHVAGTNWYQGFIAEEVLLPADAGAEKFIYETRGNEGLQDVNGGKRAPGGDTARIDPPENATQEAKLDEYAFETTYDYRYKNADEVADQLGAPLVNGLSTVERRRLSRAMDLKLKIQVKKEKAAASLVFGTSNYESALWYGTGGGQSAIDFGATGIIESIASAKRAVARLCGFEPDTLTLGYTKWLDLFGNADILARITGGANNAQPAAVNQQLVAQLLGIKKLVVASPVTQASAAPAATPSSATDIWTATSAALTYSGHGIEQDTASPAFGKMFYTVVPGTQVRYDVRTWTSGNGKLEHIEVTEFFAALQTMKAGGAIFTT